MAANVIDRVWANSRAVNGSLIVLLAIAHESKREGMAVMSVGELASKSRLSERSVQAAVRDLVTLGELHVTAGGGRGHRSGYRVTTVNPAESAPFEPVNPADSAPFAGNPAESAPFAPEGNPAESAPFTGHNGRSAPLAGLKGAESAPLKTSDMFVVTTGIDEVQVKEVPAIVQREDVERLCRHLADRIAANGSKRPVISRRWRDAARLMLDNDGRTEQQVMTAINWCQDHEFWRANILSMPKLREKYDQLRLQASRVNGNGSTTNARVRAGLDLAEKYALQERQLS